MSNSFADITGTATNEVFFENFCMQLLMWYTYISLNASFDFPKKMYIMKNISANNSKGCIKNSY